MRELPDPFVLAVLLADSLLLLLFFDRFLTALRAGFACFKDLYSTLEMLGNKSLSNAVPPVFFLLLPFYAETLLLADVSLLDFFSTLGLLLALVLFSWLSCRAMGWLGGDPATFRAVERVAQAVSVVAMAASFVVLMLGWVLPELPRWMLVALLAAMAAVAAAVFVWRGTAIILQNRFSILFWVLYLCALEFLPISVVVNIMMLNGN